MSVKRLKIASLNAERDHSDGWAREDVVRILDAWKPDLLGIQEGKQYLTTYGSLPGYGLLLPEGLTRGDQKNNPILYRTATMDPVLSRYVKVHSGKAHQFPERNIIEGCFSWEGGDGSLVWLDNTHLNSHIDQGGHPMPLPGGRSGQLLPRVPLSVTHIETIAERTERNGKRRHSLAFLSGDFNIDEDADNRVHWSGFPEATFGRHNILSVYDELGTPASFDTHGDRKIDVIARYKGDRRVRAKYVRHSGDLHSDHAAVLAAFDVTLLG